MIISKTGETDIHCTDKYFQRLKDILTKEHNSIMIFGARWPAHISNLEFDNKIMVVQIMRFCFHW